MLHADVFVLHAVRLGFRLGERLVKVGGNIDLAGFPAAAGNPRHALDEVQRRLGDRTGVYIHLGEYLGRKASVLRQQCIQKVLLLHAVILIADGDVLCGLYRFKGFLCVLVRIHITASFISMIQMITC